MVRPPSTFGKNYFTQKFLDDLRDNALVVSMRQRYVGQLREHGHFTDTLHQDAARPFLVVSANLLFSGRKVARPERFELPTFWFVAI